MTFQQSIKTCLLQKYIDFDGRAARSEYWWFTMLVTGILFILAIILFALFVRLNIQEDTSPIDEISTVEGIIFVVTAIGSTGFYLATLLPMIAVSVRRFHDYDLSGWIFLALCAGMFVPFVGAFSLLAIIIIACLKGTETSNKYGDNPLAYQHI